MRIEKKFKFFDIYDNLEEYYCLVTIIVDDNNNIYDISYNYEYSPGEQSKRAYPFFYSNISKELNKENIEGVIVLKNSLTEKLIEYLLMEPKELEKQIGNTWWVQYKIKIMESLMLLWE